MPRRLEGLRAGSSVGTGVIASVLRHVSAPLPTRSIGAAMPYVERNASSAAAPPAGSRLDEVAGDTAFAYEVEARTEMIDACSAHVGERKRGALVAGVGLRPGAPFLHEPVPLQLHLAHRITELVSLRCLAQL